MAAHLRDAKASIERFKQEGFNYYLTQVMNTLKASRQAQI